jgi:hypothetical protein
MAFIDRAKAWTQAHPKAVACIVCGLFGFLLALWVVK